MNVNPVGSGAESAFGLQGMQRPHPPSFSNTASLLGLSSSGLGTQLQSGSTLADIAQQKGVSSSDLVASVEKDLQANAPQGAPSLSDSQLQQMATNIIDGTRPTPPDGRGGERSDFGGQALAGQRPSLSNTASLLGVSSDDLSTELQSGSTLQQLASEKGVSSTDLLASVETDLQANAPQGAPSLSNDQLNQIASDIISGRGPHGASETANSNLQTLADNVGMDPSLLLSQLLSGTSLGDLLNNSSDTGYGSGVADSISGGVAFDEYA